MMMIYVKSARGYDEFANGKRSLHFKERQVLLLLDGSRTLGDLEKLFSKEHLEQIVQKLKGEGYIQAVGETRQHFMHAATAISINDLSFKAIDSAKLTNIKTILTEASRDYLGLMGRSIQSQIEASHDETSLKSSLSIWHMAMRESKLGRESASFLMEQIHQTLENKMMGADTHTH